MRTITRLVLLFIAVFVAVPMVGAHGTGVTYTVAEDNNVTLEALYDDGEPMAEAQVVVYAPSDPETAYLRGVADAEGRYTFEVDTAIAGSWDVTVRTAGHGDIVRITVTDGGEIRPMDAAGFAIPRQLLAVVVIAALGGIAYFYSRKPKSALK